MSPHAGITAPGDRWPPLLGAFLERERVSFTPNQAEAAMSIVCRSTCDWEGVVVVPGGAVFAIGAAGWLR